MSGLDSAGKPTATKDPILTITGDASRSFIDTSLEHQPSADVKAVAERDETR
jgi:hypothetical protein